VHALRDLPDKRTVVAALAVMAVTVALFLPSFGRAGPEMDEGLLVAYPTFVLDGDVPGRDFTTFYGPGGPWLIAGAFEAFGPSVTTERAVGLAFRLVVVLSLFAIALPWGRGVAIASAVTATLLMLHLGLAAFAWYGALALALAGLALLSRSLVATGDRAAAALPFAAGVCSGLASAFRWDFAVAVAVSALPLVLGIAPRLRVRYAAGAAVGLIPVVVWLALLGLDGAERILSDLRAQLPGRRLPLPDLGYTDGQLLWATIGAAALVLLTGLELVRSRREPSDRLVLALGLFVLALLPGALERADQPHIVYIGCLAVPLLPIAGAELLGRSPGGPAAIKPRPLWLAGLGVVSLLAVVAVVHQSGASFRDLVLNLPGDTVEDFEVEHRGRSFPIDSESVAGRVNALLPEVESATSPGDSLFVGPRNLRRSNFNDTFLYFLLPDLRPASFYTEMNPWQANRPGSGLARDLRGADVLILTARYDDWDEPNASSELGSTAPSNVVERRFCLRAREGSYRLLERCPDADADAAR
jgi:hypothetical protein